MAGVGKLRETAERLKDLVDDAMSSVDGVSGDEVDEFVKVVGRFRMKRKSGHSGSVRWPSIRAWSRTQSYPAIEFQPPISLRTAGAPKCKFSSNPAGCTALRDVRFEGYVTNTVGRAESKETDRRKLLHLLKMWLLGLDSNQQPAG